MRAVLKYVLPPLKVFTMELPRGATIVKVGMQRRIGHIWAEVDVMAAMVTRSFVLCGTGQEIPKDATWVATFFEDDATWVWHLYEVTI